MDDQSRHAATGLDTDFTLTIDEAVERYSRAGRPARLGAYSAIAPKSTSTPD